MSQIPELNTSLKYLNCGDNQLTQLPELNSSLKKLYCGFNQITQLPKLNNCLESLYCHSNQLIQLPKLNSSLRYLYCVNNKIMNLPELNNCLHNLFCYDNQLPVNIKHTGFLTSEKRNELNYKIRCLEHFKELYHSLKYKKQIRDWLWIKVRLPRIQNKFHPYHLEEILCTVNDEDLDETLNKW